jgi:hypothetical protein
MMQRNIDPLAPLSLLICVGVCVVDVGAHTFYTTPRFFASLDVLTSRLYYFDYTGEDICILPCSDRKHAANPNNRANPFF